MNENIYSMTNNLLDSLFDEADKGIISNYTYKKLIDTFPNDYKIDLSEFKKIIDEIYEKQIQIQSNISKIIKLKQQ